jgi:hypothetical protein
MSGGQLGMFYVVSFTGFLWEMGLFITLQLLSSSRLLAALKLPALLAIHSMKGKKR